MIQSLENIKKSVSEFPSLVRDLKEYLDNRCTHFRAGCITESMSYWQMITSDEEILTSVRGATMSLTPNRITLNAHNPLSLLKKVPLLTVKLQNCCLKTLLKQLIILLMR